MPARVSGKASHARDRPTWFGEHTSDAGQDAPRPRPSGSTTACEDAALKHTPNLFKQRHPEQAVGDSSVFGGVNDEAVGLMSWIDGGEDDIAKGNSSSILGLNTKEASGGGEVLY